MDGNRRFAKNHKIEVVEGHNLGFEALAKILEVCYKIGVKCVTIYAFSIENFKRTKYEVDALMDMAKTKLSQLAQHGELLERYGAKMQFLGQKEMVRPDVLEAIEKAIALTSGNGRATLNICAPYTSRDEITTAIRNTVLDFTKPMRPVLKRPFSETHIARNIKARQLSTVTENDETNGAEKSDSAAEEEAIAAYNRIDNIVERYLENLDPDQSFDAPTDTVLDILRDHSLSEEEKRSAVDRTLNSPISNTDFADLKALTALLDPTASQDSSTLNLSTSDPTTNTSLPPNTNYPDPETITEDTITAHTFTGADTPPLDLLIRTSGVERLSDFMLWQCHQDTEIVFLKCMWPEFDLWHFMPVLLEWQWQRRKGLPLEFQELKKRL